MFVLTDQSTADGTTGEKKQDQDYGLRIESDLISLQATDIPLIQIVEYIGEQMDIQVIVQIPRDERITTQFEALPLEKALQRLSQNHALVTDKEAGTISKIFLLPKGQETPMEPAAVSLPEPVSLPESASVDADAVGRTEDQADPKQPKPFEFTFDPSQFEPQHP